VIIMQLYIFYPLLRFLVQRKPKTLLAVSFVLTAYFQTSCYLFERNIKLLPTIGVSYYYLIFPSWIFFFVFGLYLSNNYGKMQNIFNFGLVAPGLLWLLSLAALIADGRLTGTYGSSIKPSVMLYCLTSFIFLFIIAKKLKDLLPLFNKMFGWISAQSFVIYFSHLLLTGIFRSLVRVLGIEFTWEGSVGMVLLSAVAILISLVFSYIVSFVPYAPLIGGAYIKRNGNWPVNTKNKVEA
jgi:membrane-bound acyltransferase YfiQ involved in biofilm formation